MKYYANFTANNGTSLIEPLEDTNKARIIKSIREIANGERFAGNTCRWHVSDETHQIIAAGYTDRDGVMRRE